MEERLTASEWDEIFPDGPDGFQMQLKLEILLLTLKYFQESFCAKDGLEL
jgi:hypothetical protein